MSVRDRLDDAVLLIRGGRTIGGLLMLLVAIAATSRKRFPEGTPSRRTAPTKPTKSAAKPAEMGDGEAFETFFAKAFADTSSVRTSGSWTLHYRGKQERFEHIFYKWMRCTLAHKGALPNDIQFEVDQPDPTEEGWRIQVAGPGPNDPLRLSRGFLDQLVGMVVHAPENAAECADLKLPKTP